MQVMAELRLLFSVLTVDHILPLHHVFALLLQEVGVDGQAPGVRLEILPLRLELTQHLRVELLP